jgi:hypothetical protein
MKRNSFILGIPAMALVFGLVLSGCPTESTDSGGEEGLPEKDAQVYQDDGTLYTGSGTLKFTERTYDTESHNYKNEAIAEAGKVSGGKLTLSLPQPIPAAYLDEFDDYDGITVTPKNVPYYFGGLYLFDGDAERGELFLGGGSENGSSYSVEYWYFPSAVTITGESTENSSSGKSYITNYNIEAKAGWNAVINSYTSSEDSSTDTYTTDLSKIPSDVKLMWFID